MTYLLNESSLGLQLFKLNSLDKLSLQDQKVLKQLESFQTLKNLVSLESAYFFHGHGVAVQTIQSLQKGEISEELLNWLQQSLPGIKKEKIKIGVQDKTLAQEISSKTGFRCVSGDVYLEVFRAIRQNLCKFLIKNQEENITQSKLTQANLGLGHAIARNCIKFDEKKQDKTIINCFALLEQMEKNLNTFCMRIKEGYSWHFPELAKIVSDNETYSRLVALIGNKANISQIDLEEITSLTGDESLSRKIVERTQSSVGNTLSQVDEDSLVEFAEYVLRHFDYKRELQGYLKEQMSSVAPNLTSILGESIGAKLLTQSGGLSNLAKLPSSTIQILGAEKALFRAIRNKGQTPKYGLLFNSSYIQKSKANAKGKISRMLANKCALASRLDFFLQRPSSRFGEFFKDQLTEKLSQPDNADIGKRNIEQMESLVNKMIKKKEYLAE